ncbi:hypothetical protein ACF3NA_02735 [Alkanindiges sp. WGS2144]|uniref:hypothetical protein n=1 Tax=Alkanindiges sp. WGS2144 TaxID=3366808 RepID=UPI003753037E
MSLAHAQHFDAIALHIVKPEIDASLLQVQNTLSAFIDDSSNTFGLTEAAESMAQIYGVLRLLDITGAIELADAAAQLMNHIVTQGNSTTDQQLAAMSEGLMLLSRYLEFVVLRENLLPHLLLPSINRIRVSLGLPTLREGFFLEPYLGIIQLPQLNLNLQKPDISTGQIRQLGTLYKVALSHILKKQVNTQDFEAIKLVSHFSRMLAASSSSELYWHAVNIALTELEYCNLSDTRLRTLIQVERNLQNFLNDPAAFSPSLEDMADILTLSACRDHEAADELRQQLGLNEYIMSDAQSSLLARYLFGPDSETIHITTDLMQQEITEVKNKIDSLQHGDKVDGGFETVAAKLHELSSALTLLNLEEAAKLLGTQAQLVSGWQNLFNIDEVNHLMDALLYAGNALTVLDRSYVAGANKLPFYNLQISLYQLEEARATLVKETRDTLTMSMHSLTAYIDSKDLLHMNNVPAMFNCIAGALIFLDARNGHDMLKTTAQFIERAFAPDQPAPSQQNIDRLANVMITVDHYLEGLQLEKPLGVHPFTVGLQSAQQLEAA